jgi:SEC-C motif
VRRRTVTARAAIVGLSKTLAAGQAARDAEAALAADDFDTATTALLAGALKGEALDFPKLGKLLRGVDDPILICALLGRAGAQASDAACEALEEGPLTTAQEAHLLFAAVHALGDSKPSPRLLAQLRLRARVAGKSEDAPILEAALATGLGLESKGKDVRARADEARGWMTGPLEKVLPEEPLLGPPLPGTRKLEKVPRNAPCPCGSGKKYKACHGGAGDDEARAGDGLDGRLKAASPELLPKHVDALRLIELLRLDFAAMTTLALKVAYDRLAGFARLEVAERALEQLLTRKDLGKPAPDDYRIDFILYALEHDDPARAEKWKARLDKPERWDALHQLELEWLKGPVPAERLEAVAREALASATEPGARELAWVLARRSPALGILVARGAMATSTPHAAEELLFAAEEARDRLLLPAAEPGWAMFDALFPESKKSGDSEKAREAADARARELERRLTETQRKLTEAEGQLHAHRPEQAADPEEQDRQKLAQKVNELKELLKESNRERSELRRALEDAHATAEAAPAAPAAVPAPAEEPEEGDGLEAPRNVLTTQFARAAADALERLPKNIARDAVLKVSEVAAGLPTAWREVKRMLHVPGYYSVRVGIHHRVLFHLDDRVLQVDDVIHRQDLDATVRRLGR